MKEKKTGEGLFVINIAAFLVPFMGASLNLALPSIGETFSMKAVTLTWLATSYLISTAVFQIPLAKVADIVGRRKIFILGLSVFSLSTLLSGFALSAQVLIFLRVLSGIGSAMIFGTNIAILTSLVSAEKRGQALGINTAVVYAALALGPFLGGIITDLLGWQGIFYVTAGVGLLVLFLAHFFLKGEWMESRGEKFDLLGSLLHGTALASLIYGFSLLPSKIGFLFLLIGICLFIGFFFFEKKQLYPVFNVRLFGNNKVFALSSLAALINYSATAAIAFMLSLYLQYVRGLEASVAGLILISQAFVQSLFSLVVGQFSHLYSPSKMATLGMFIIVIGISGLVFLSPTTPYWLIVLLLMFLGIGFGIFSSPNTHVIMSSVDRRYYTQASATTGTMRLTGQAFSMGIASMAISFYVGNQKISPELYTAFMKSIKMTFIIFVSLCLLGMYASSARIEKKKERV